MMISARRGSARHTLDRRRPLCRPVLPEHPWWGTANWSEGKRLPEGFEYSSDNNTQWMTIDELRVIVGEHCG